jgi:DNA-binding response OmpR family regulator
MTDRISKILIVEDDLELAALIADRLKKEGYQTFHVTNGKEAVAEVLEKNPDLVILDLMLPEMDGFEVCRQVRPTYRGTILILTARDDDLDQIIGLELGADDYVVKPVRPRVLLARIRALLRRNAKISSDSESAVLRVGDLIVDGTSREVHFGSQPIHLTTAEFDLLFFLANHAGNPVSRDEIHLALYNTEYDGLDRAIDVYVSRIRQKLGDDPHHPRLLKTVRGVGYLLSGSRK